jgi:phosphohistidine phosphatase
MKGTLFLVRHAKDDVTLPDKERPLADHGKRDAPMMGKRLAKRQVRPDLILSSPARRALFDALEISEQTEI